MTDMGLSIARKRLWDVERRRQELADSRTAVMGGRSRCHVGSCGRFSAHFPDGYRGYVSECSADVEFKPAARELIDLRLLSQRQIRVNPE
jgi:hypothetical protein